MSDDPENPRDPREVAESRTTWGRGDTTPDELDEADALSIVPQVAAGLDATHRAGVIHRDFECANVLLVPERGSVRAVVTDFGLARREETGKDPSTTMSGGGLIGSPAYMAPKRVEGLELARAADLYALGVVLYEMRTGALPFVGATPGRPRSCWWRGRRGRWRSEARAFRLTDAAFS